MFRKILCALAVLALFAALVMLFQATAKATPPGLQITERAMSRYRMIHSLGCEPVFDGKVIRADGREVTLWECVILPGEVTE